MSNSSNWASAISAVAALSLSAPVAAVTLSGAITAHGRAVESAVVSAYADAVGARKVVTITNAAGAYRFGNLQKGVHIVIVEKDGRRIYQGSTNVQADPTQFNVGL